MSKKLKKKRWSKDDSQALFNGVGINGLVWFKKHCGGRTAASVYAQLRKEYGPGGLTKGVYTINELVVKTGYQQSHIFRAGDALNQKWKRLGPRGVYLITEEQVREITTWLVHDYWSKKHRLYCCAWCTVDHNLHYSVGLCSKCYAKYRRLCASYKIPYNVAMQLKILRKIPKTADNTILKQVSVFKVRLAMGLALEKEQIEGLSKCL
jgi:hypothetical protein